MATPCGRSMVSKCGSPKSFWFCPFRMAGPVALALCLASGGAMLVQSWRPPPVTERNHPWNIDVWEHPALPYPP